MPVERDAILIDNFKECLRLYERSLVWAMTASAAFFLLSLRLREPNPESVDVLYAKLNVAGSWFIAMTLFFLLGGFALSALRRAELVYDQLRLVHKDPEWLGSVLLYPSLATTHSGFFRIGCVLFCPATFLIGFVVEWSREWGGKPWYEVMSKEIVIGFIIMILMVLAVYGSIVERVWRPLGSRKGETSTKQAEPSAAPDRRGT